MKSHVLGAKTLFQMLPKTKQSKVTTDFRPIANIRLMYKIFAYLILGRIEAPLEHCQPEEQHGFRSNRRIEEHLLTANMVIDKTLLGNTPLWIVRKAVRKSKLAHHIGRDHSIDIEHTFSKTAKASSTPTEERNPIWVLDC